MALYKDGEVIRTYEEQIDHLTAAHREQLNIKIECIELCFIFIIILNSI